MDDTTFGKALFVGIVLTVIWGITALAQAKGEGARRARLVLGGVILLAVVWVLLMTVGPVGLVAVLAIIGAGYWIFAGSRKKP